MKIKLVRKLNKLYHTRQKKSIRILLKVIFLHSRNILNKQGEKNFEKIFFPEHKKLASHHNIARYFQKTDVNDNLADEKSAKINLRRKGKWLKKF